MILYLPLLTYFLLVLRNGRSGIITVLSKPILVTNMQCATVRSNSALSIQVANVVRARLVAAISILICLFLVWRIFVCNTFVRDCTHSNIHVIFC